jgi:hypothetical protein
VIVSSVIPSVVPPSAETLLVYQYWPGTTVGSL